MAGGLYNYPMLPFANVLTTTAKMKTAPPEEIERLNVEKELKEQMLSDWQKVDRIIAVRLLIITKDE